MVSGLVLSMIGPVTGLGTRMTGVLGPEDWSWNSQEWRNSAEVQPQKLEWCRAATVDSSDQSAPRASKTVRATKPGLMTNLFVGACLLIGALSFRSATNADSECAKLDANARK